MLNSGSGPHTAYAQILASSYLTAVSRIGHVIQSINNRVILHVGYVITFTLIVSVNFLSGTQYLICSCHRLQAGTATSQCALKLS